MTRTRRLAYLLSALIAANGMVVAQSSARTAGLRVIQLPGRSISIAVSPVASAALRGGANADLKVAIHNAGPKSVTVSPTDFALSSQADTFGVRAWDHRPASVTVMPHRSRAFRLSFRVPGDAMPQASLSYRFAGETRGLSIPLNSGPRRHGSAVASPTINTFYVSHGNGEPWGTAIDNAGNVWFAEPGCDFAPTCGPGTPPGQIGELTASSHNVSLFTLPNIPGNQPIFLTFDAFGNLWFTTPNNDKIGEFNPSTQRFMGQWDVTRGSGPWDLASSGRSIWYTDHLGSAVSRFNTVTHAHQDFPTPSPNANPYGIAISPHQVWFTENNSNVDRVAVYNTLTGAIAEYPIVLPLSGTPHMISIDASGHPWWTEGFSNTIATLNPAAATPGQCGVVSGTCNGMRRVELPAATGCFGSSHTSGITVQRNSGLVWLDDSLTAQVGSFNPASDTFALNTLNDCNAHPHDGLTLDAGHNVWFDEEFNSAIGELIP